MTDTLVSVHPNGTAPNPFRIAARHKWLSFESPDPEEHAIWGEFRAKIRMPTYGELLAENEALVESEEAFFALAAPRIVAWNALAVDDNGNESPIPAPGDHPDNWRAVYTLERPLAAWLLVALRTGHHSDKQREETKKKLAALLARTSEPPNASKNNAPESSESP